MIGGEYCGKTVHFGVWDLYYLLIGSTFMHSVHSCLATFYPVVKGIRSNHWHFLYRTVTSARRYFFSFSMVAKEPIKLLPAEVQWPNTQDINLATPLNFCFRVPAKVKWGKMMSAPPGLRGSLAFSKARIGAAPFLLFISSPFLQSTGGGGRREKERRG